MKRKRQKSTRNQTNKMLQTYTYTPKLILFIFAARFFFFIFAISILKQIESEKNAIFSRIQFQLKWIKWNEKKASVRNKREGTKKKIFFIFEWSNSDNLNEFIEFFIKNFFSRLLFFCLLFSALQLVLPCAIFQKTNKCHLTKSNLYGHKLIEFASIQHRTNSVKDFEWKRACAPLLFAFLVM